MSYIIVSKKDVDDVNPKIKDNQVIFNSFNGDKNNLKLNIKYETIDGENLVLDVGDDLSWTFRNFAYFNISFQFIA